MVNRLPIGAGIDSIPTETIPGDPKEFVDWFKGVGVKRWFGPADVRNAFEGSGIAITNNGFNTPPTIAISQDFQDLFAQPYVIFGSPVGAPLTDYRSIAAQVGVLSLTDAGAEGALTVGVVNNGIGNAQLRQGAPFTVIGNATAGIANVSDLSQAQLTALINLSSASAAGAIPALSGNLTDYLAGTGVFHALPSVTVPVGANPTASVGLAAVNGSATTFMRSDGSPALSQAISPTMTGNWVFTPSTGVAITVNGPANAASVGIISANSATAVIADLFVWRAAGTANAMNQGPSVTVLETTAQVGGTLQASGGQIELWQVTGAGPAGRQIWKVLSAGGITFDTAITASAAITANAGAIFNGSSSAAVVINATAGFVSLAFAEGNATKWQIVENLATSGKLSFFSNTTGNEQIGITGAGNCTHAAPSSGDTLTTANVAGGNALVVNGNSAGTAVVRVNTQATTGAKTASFVASNKPGTNNQTTPVTWLPVNVDGTVGYIPVFAA